MATTHDLTPHDTPLADIRQHPANPRNGDTDAIGESLEANGQYLPIVVARDGTILVGNHRYASALELGWESIKVIRLDLDPESPEALRIMTADNRTSDLGRYDDAGLLRLLSSIDSVDGLLGTAYSAEDLRDLARLENIRAHVPLQPGFTSGSALTRDGVSGDPGMAGRLEGYITKGSRPVILDYALAEYEAVQELLTAARSRAGVDTNADAVRTALTEYVA